MIYGLNFNNTEIPAALARKFKKRDRVLGVVVHLTGVADTHEHRRLMLLQVTRPGRTTLCVPRRVKGGYIWGIYCN